MPSIPSWTSIVLFFLSAIASAAIATLALNGCGPGWNDPHPVIPEPNNPCGRDWFVCFDVCCYQTDICRRGGYCAFGGLEPPTWGAARDGGTPDRGPAAYRGLTPEQIRQQQSVP
jgi:hypothetical protein